MRSTSSPFRRFEAACDAEGGGELLELGDLQGARAGASSIALLSYVLIVAAIDVRTHRIPNVIVAIAIVVGSGMQVWTHGEKGLLIALGGFAVGLTVFLPFYILRAFGAGDVKAMAAAGAFLGAELALLAAALTLAAGSILGLIVLFRTASSPAAAFHRVLGFAAAPVSFARETRDPNTTQRRQRFPYGVAIAAGVLATLLWSGRLSFLSDVALHVK